MTLADDLHVTAVVKTSLADIKTGSFVGATALPEENGRWRAVEVHIFPESGRGSGAGDRSHDLMPKSTMTNGTVDAMTRVAMNGAVEKAEGTTLTLKYKDGEKQIDVTSETAIVSFATGSKDELKSGAKIFVSAAMR